ncbi:MAG: NADH:flavin oxidoreductase, partial [Halobacteriales archaeon]|nr:NADH:flavin oxidoreductase [Halobacteriales archaeon]
GGRIFLQLEHGGLRSMETWHAEYRDAHPDLEQLAPSGLPWQLRLLDRLGFLEYDPHVLTTEEVYELAADFGRAAGHAVAAGYDGIHLAGANMGLIQQFLSPYYNRRDDEFGGSLAARARFLEVLYEEIRAAVGPDVPIITKIPAETEAPPFVRRHLTRTDGVELCQRAAEMGFDALVPVNTSVFWDLSIVRGEYPKRAWNQSAFQTGYARVFGSRLRARLVAFLSWLESFVYTFEPAWNADYCRTVRERVDVPILCEGGIRERERIDRLLGDACDMVGIGRPFYAEPRLPARLLDTETKDVAVICENCNNCTVPQVTGEAGVCRTPAVLRRRGELEQADAYDR